jgi:hypothetical protein
MAYHKNTVNLEKMLLKFLGEPDPMLSMLEWLCHKMMEVEVENKLSAGKGEHSPNRTGYRSGTRVRRFDTPVILAVKFELAGIIFNYQGKRVTDLFCVKKKGVKDRINRLFGENGYNIEYMHLLPQKRLAVCSGLAEYGKNNITLIMKYVYPILLN